MNAEICENQLYWHRSPDTLKSILQSPHALKFYISVSTLKHTPLHRHPCRHPCMHAHTGSHTHAAHAHARMHTRFHPHAHTHPTHTHAEGLTQPRAVCVVTDLPDLLIGEVFMSCAPLLTPGIRSLGGRGVVHLRRRGGVPRGPRGLSRCPQAPPAPAPPTIVRSEDRVWPGWRQL